MGEEKLTCGHLCHGSFDYLKDDVTCLDTKATLLSKPDKFLFASSNDKSTQQGTYLYYDNNDMKWICSGKVTMRGFSVRHEEHKKKARASKQTSASKLYSCYPSNKSSCSKSTI
eukprot:4278547-Ditylum_brightwellii.AAC.1